MKNVLVFVTRAANVTIDTYRDFLKLFQARRHDCKIWIGLDWTGLDLLNVEFRLF